MIRRYGPDAQANRDCIEFSSSAAFARNASSRETGRVARIQEKEIANPASGPDSGVFFDHFDLIVRKLKF